MCGRNDDSFVSSQTLRPLGRFATEESLGLYPPTSAGDMVQEELQAINLSRS